MDILKLKQFQEDEGVILSFNGKISQEIVVSLCETVEKELVAMEVKSKTIHNVFAILTEQMHNIMSYSGEKNHKSESRCVGLGITVVGYDLDKSLFFVGSGNYLRSGDEWALQNKIDAINQMDEVELKAHYKELRRSGENKHQRGAGLGFVEMRRHASEPLEYEIRPKEMLGSFFTIKVYI